MDYLDPAKDFRERIVLWLGYLLVAIAIVIATDILVNLAYGYNLGKDGTVVQNGLVYFSSQPNPAHIYISGKLQSQSTNSRLLLPAGIYQVKLSRSGYRDWTRQVEVDGGLVEHFDYPLLLPSILTSKKINSYQSAPGLASQSPDRRWLLVQSPGSDVSFDLYDLKNPAKVIQTSINLPSGIITKATNSSSYKALEWADDNVHVLLEHDYDGKTEFILINRSDVTQSVNLNTTLDTSPVKLTLSNKKFDQYYLLDSAGNLQTANQNTPTPVTVQDHVLAYQTYGSDTILFVTDASAPPGKVLVRLKVGSTSYTIRSLPPSPTYLVNLTTYNSALYVAAGSALDNRVFIYQNPVGQLAALPTTPLLTTWTLHLPSPNFLSFSTNAQFIMAENGDRFSVYDFQNSLSYNYTDSQPIDAPSTHAAWMDGDRLVYVSAGHLIMQDYDNNNLQAVVPADSQYPAVFSPDYKYVYDFANSGSGLNLNQTPLLRPADL